MLMAFPIVPSVSAADSYTFYGYGGSLGGVPMAYNNGYAYLSTSSAQNSSLPQVYFTPGTDNSTNFVAHSNTTATPGAKTLSSNTLAIPRTGVSSRQVGFVNGTSTTDLQVAPVILYGGTVLVQQDSGLQSLFYASTTSRDGVWEIMWNPENPNESTLTPLTLRILPPSNS